MWKIIQYAIFEFTTTYILYTICFSYITRINKNELNKPGKADLQVKVNPSCVTVLSLWNDRNISFVVLWIVPPLGRMVPQNFPIFRCEAEGPSNICKKSKLHIEWSSTLNFVNSKIMICKCKTNFVYSTVQILYLCELERDCCLMSKEQFFTHTMLIIWCLLCEKIRHDVLSEWVIVV